MHFQTLILASLAALATASPAPITKRDEWVGYVFSSQGALAGDLIRNGGCCNFPVTGYSTQINAGVRCRFFRNRDCGSLIGGTDGLPSNGGGRQTLGAPANSATCWYG